MLKSVLSVLVPEISMIENIDITNENMDITKEKNITYNHCIIFK